MEREIVVGRIGRVSDSHPWLQIHDVTTTIGTGIWVFGFHGNGPFSVARFGLEIDVGDDSNRPTNDGVEDGLYAGTPR